MSQTPHLLPANARVLLGVSGGIAAYKAASLLRLLQKRGCTVRVVMSQAAEQFITPMTFQALSGQPVLQGSLFDPEAGGNAMEHIELARWADLILVAPATADLLSRLCQGRADDLLSAVCLAGDSPLALAPAMNRLMWEHSATQHNCALLRERGTLMLGPARGLQACGETGVGRMLEPEQLLRCLLGEPAEGALSRQRILISAGPTHEDLDSVRYLGNRSSGRMGYALALEAAAMGAEVTLISGPTALPSPYGVNTVRVRSAQQMHDAVLDNLPGTQMFIAAAAVADFTPEQKHSSKIKKHGDEGSLQITLMRTVDILSAVTGHKDRPQLVVGFAAETDNMLEYATAKLRNKALDYIVANDVSDERIGFDSRDNRVTLIDGESVQEYELQPKTLLAARLLEVFAQKLMSHPQQTDENST